MIEETEFLSDTDIEKIRKTYLERVKQFLLVTKLRLVMPVRQALLGS